MDGCRCAVASGPLAPYASGYGAWLAAQGYSRWTIGNRLWQLELLSRWLKDEGLAAGELTGESAERFVARRAAGCLTWFSARSVVLPLGFLRGLGVVPSPPVVVADGPVEEVLDGYRRYMVSEWGGERATPGCWGDRAGRSCVPLAAAKVWRGWAWSG